MRMNWNFLGNQMPPELKELCKYARDFEFNINYVINDIESGRFPSVTTLLEVSNLIESLLTQTMSIVKTAAAGKEDLEEVEKKFKAFRFEIMRFRQQLNQVQTTRNLPLFSVSVRNFKLFYDSVVVSSILEAKRMIEVEYPRKFAFAVRTRIGMLPTKKDEKEIKKDIEGED